MFFYIINFFGKKEKISLIKNIILIGYGSHAKKRIIPSINKTKLKLLDIVKKKDVFSDLKTLPTSDSNTISYICTPPNSHYKLIIFLLKKKSNVIVEKPAILKKKQLLTIEQILFKNSKLIFIENIMYLYSKIIKKLYSYWIKNEKKVRKININFLIPNFFNIGFRKKSSDNYLVLHDIGIYPLSLINFLNIKVSQITILKKNYTGKKLENIKIRISSDKLIININIGEDKNYQNNLTLINYDGSKIIFDKIFTGIESEKKITSYISGKTKKTLLLKDHDCFKFFLSIDYKNLKNLKKKNLSMLKKNIYLFDRIKSKINSY